MSLAAMIWKFTGVSWSSLHILHGLFYGASAAALYFVFRLAGPPVLSLFFALFTVVSPMQVANIRLLRELTKNVFILSVIVLLFVIVTRKIKDNYLYLLMGIAGGILGFASGLRRDVDLCIPIMLLAIWFFLPGSLIKRIRLKALCSVILVGSFAICSLPIMLSLSGGSNSGALGIHGLQAPFTRLLGIKQSYYDVGDRVNDGLKNHIINTYARVVEGYQDPVETATPEYDIYGMDYYLRYLAALPADTLIRVYGAVRYALDLPFNRYYPMFGETPLKKAYSYYLKYRMLLLKPITNHSIHIVSFAIFIALLYSVRLGIFIVIMLFYFTGYTSILMEEKNYYHLEFITPLAICYILTQSYLFLDRFSFSKTAPHVRVKGLEARASLKRLGVAAFSVGGVFLLLASPLWALRSYQAPKVTRMMENYLAADTVALQYAVEDFDENHVIFRAPETFTPMRPGLTRNFHYMKAVIDCSACGADEPFTVTFQHKFNIPYLDMSRRFTVGGPGASAGPTVLFAPAYDYVTDHPLKLSHQYDGMVVPKDKAACVKEYSILAKPGEFPFQLWINLPSQWKSIKPYYVFD